MAPKVTNGSGPACRAAVLIGALATPAAAEIGVTTDVFNTYGMPGLIDMPAATVFDDGEFALGTSYMENQVRNALTFQVLPRLSGTFRYTLMYDISTDGQAVTNDYVFDRSFSLHYLLADEGRYLPSVAIGLNDFLGTGFFESEYLVASKSLTPDIRVTAGIGWGRLGSYNSFDNPLAVFDERFEERGPRTTSNTGGELEPGNWFQGPAALFGGVEWQASDRLRFVAEYSSDTYRVEDGFSFEQRSPFNFGVAYELSDRLNVHANYLYGSELGVQLTYHLNPAEPRYPSGLEGAPPPVRPVGDAAAAASWSPERAPQLQAATRAQLAGQGIGLHGLSVAGGTARVEIENDTYPQAAQAVGRTARVLTRTMPPQVGTFEITLIERGVPVSTVTIARGDMEELEFALDGAWSSFTRARIADAGPGTAPRAGLFPRFDYGISPYIEPAYFDPDDPLRADFGVDLNASYEPAPGLILSGTVRQRLFGNLNEADRPSTSVLPRVRSESNIYQAETDWTIPRLTAAYYFRPGADLYGRVTAGYLETMFGGVSGEMLYYPSGSPVAYGAEINYAVQRDFDQRLGFRDYDVVTGHGSVYYDFGNGFHGQVDAGRYLAGDWGATVSLDREFENGWSVGGFFTLTDVPFDDFGEGAFDKGIRLSIPLSWASGRPTRDTADFTIRPVWRDGGARLIVDGRLYDVVRPANGAELRDGWGRFFR